MQKIGLQLYSVKNLTKKDLLGTIQGVAKAGFDGVEFAGYFDTPAKEIKKVMDDNNIVSVGAHIGIEAISKDFNRVLDLEKELGNTNIVIPYMGEEYRDSLDAIKKTGDLFNEIGARLKGEGMQLYYHNHGFEFEQIEGEYILDRLVFNTEPDNLHLEFDTYWAEYMGLSSIDFIKKYGQRCSMLHIKEMKSLEDKRNTIVGQGIMDFETITSLGKEFGVKWFTIEQEQFEGDEMDEISQGYLYLKGIL
ncbi:MAG TPA: sugar phosphate isomerase/epimerase [Bacillota bacterium]|nr:sugar phosphate isomerase/epimerase [Bacillota bacterium]